MWIVHGSWPGISSLGECHRSCKDPWTEKWSTLGLKMPIIITWGDPESSHLLKLMFCLLVSWDSSPLESFPDFFVANDALHPDHSPSRPPPKRKNEWRSLTKANNLDELTRDATFFVIQKVVFWYPPNSLECSGKSRLVNSCCDHPKIAPLSLRLDASLMDGKMIALSCLDVHVSWESAE